MFGWRTQAWGRWAHPTRGKPLTRKHITWQTHARKYSEGCICAAYPLLSLSSAAFGPYQFRPPCLSSDENRRHRAEPIRTLETIDKYPAKIDNGEMRAVLA